MALFETKKNVPSNLLHERFLVPPFSIFDTRQWYWQDKKREWLAMGIKGELGRDENQSNKSFRNMSHITYGKGDLDKMSSQAISVFDPFLCEIMYKWFSVEGAKILDPFAGGSVRGIVAGSLGKHYYGVDLYDKQIKANEEQYIEISGEYDGITKPQWFTGDSLNIDSIVNDEFDMIFSCPPYFNLEVYSNDAADLSNMETYEEFVKAYHEIIKKSCNMLKEDSFAVFVVSNVRDRKTGELHDLVGDTVRGFTNCGLLYYNDIVLVNTAGTLPIRIPKKFDVSRRVGRQHQNILVFYKGNPDNIKNKFESIDNNPTEGRDED